MKNKLRALCLFLAIVFLMAVPVNAVSNVEPRGSAFFSSYWTFLEKTTSTSFIVFFDVTANAALMQELGASMIEVYESADQQNWTKVKTYEMEDYPEMIDDNTGSHTSYVTYDKAKSGYYYYARVTYYAKNSTGIGENPQYTQILRM